MSPPDPIKISLCMRFSSYFTKPLSFFIITLKSFLNSWFHCLSVVVSSTLQVVCFTIFFWPLLFFSHQYCSFYFRWGCALGYSIISSAGFITPFLSLWHILSFIDCIQQSLNGATVRTWPLCWADKVNWEFSNVWAVHTFLFNKAWFYIA